jgi:hypothetical protein
MRITMYMRTFIQRSYCIVARTHRRGRHVLGGGILVVLVFSTVFGLSAGAQTAPNATQVPAGSTAAIGPATGPGAATPDTPQGKILKGALAPETRKTLQEAMDATPAPK